MSSLPADFDVSKLKGDDKTYLNGIKFDKDLAQSPVDKPRRCTDIVCCILFSAVVVAMFICTFYGYMNGEPWKLIAPIDGNGNICGWTAGYEDYSHLYIGDITTAGNPSNIYNIFNYGVCAKECPAVETDVIECIPTDKVQFQANSKTTHICTPATGDEYATTEILSYCLPVYDTLPQSVQDNWEKLIDALGGSTFGGMFADVLTAKWVMLIGVFICIAVTFIYIMLMHKCAFWLSWISVGLIQVSLVGIGYMAFAYKKDLIEDDPAYAEESGAKWLSWITWLSWIFAGIYYIVIICSFQSLRVAVAVIQTTASFVADSKRLILVPILYFGVGILLTFMFMAALVCTSSIGEITVENQSHQSKDIVWDPSTEYMFYFMVFGFLWVLAFVMAVNEFVIICATITWYYSDKLVEDSDGIPGDSDVSVGMKWSLRYHAGTLAFGSLIQAIVWAIRVIFEYVAKKIEAADPGNGCTKCIVGCLRCCLACFDRFIRYINRNAYIYCALSGEGYCSSAINSFILILKNAAKFGFVEGIAGCFMFIAKFFIATITSLISFFVMKAMVKVSSPYAPLLVVFLISYLIATIFIEIFDTGANTILQCYLLDREVGLCNDEHIPRSLKKFFSESEIQAAMDKDKVAESQEALMDKGANNMQ